MLHRAFMNRIAPEFILCRVNGKIPHTGPLWRASGPHAGERSAESEQNLNVRQIDEAFKQPPMASTEMRGGGCLVPTAS
jgi:hypothetical protein